MNDLRHLGESCLGVFIAFACLSYFFLKNNRIEHRLNNVPMLWNWDKETSKAWARICAAISICGLAAGVALIEWTQP